MKKLIALLLSITFFLMGCNNAPQKETQITPAGLYNEPHRPQVHFSPKEKWMNDPNGLVFYAGQYHLFFQYYPDSTVWGPMHWGHATSTDMISWKEQPIALYPDSLGYIFSGSAVVDSANTSGLGKDAVVPLVAIFTHHNAAGEKSGSKTYQNQSLAYSLDSGKTWQKYAGNPVLKNPGITDFRDPKVSWYPAEKKWIMTLATKDCISFYSSPNLKNWVKESEFGETLGAHGGVWECPDLFPMEYEGKTIWVLLVSINPGGPGGGSATQYFTGNFDGKTFTPFQTATRWIDYGSDNYAGVTWSNTGKRKIFLGWMSNWLYANVVPTEKWRSAMTVPRELKLEKVAGNYVLASYPVKEMDKLQEDKRIINDIDGKNYDLSKEVGQITGPVQLHFVAPQLNSFNIVFANSKGEQLIAGYDQAKNEYYIDRSKAGDAKFDARFAARHTGPRLSTSKDLLLTIVLDNASIEMFADNGLTTMTDIFFPSEIFSTVKINSPSDFPIQQLEFSKLKRS
ncbi:MAG: glycoside hydrolase family 32 protein [Chitinophagaceae bacterium]